MLRVAELCAGYGGLTMALAAVWPVELAWYAENDPDASKVLAAHHPGVPNAGDITAAQFSACEPVDVLAAGFPCTPASVAGPRRGSEDERWLWPDVARAVRMLRPPVFVGENVPGLLTIERGQLFGQLLADLDDLGYTVRWTTVGACRVGLCHHRHRVFILASLAGPAGPDRWPVARRAGRAGPVAGRSPGWEVAGDTLFGVGLTPQWPAAGIVSGGTVWAEPVVTCGADGIVLPTPRASDGNKGGPNQHGSSGDLALPAAAQPGRFGRYEAAVRRHELVTGRPAPEPTEPGPNGKPRLAPLFVEWMLTLPANAVTGLLLPMADPRPDWISRRAALRILGNGVVPQQGAYALSKLADALPVPDLAEVG